MTDFALLDVAIGVIFAILTFSLIASALQEALASALNWRGRMLRRGLFRLLEGATDHGAELVNAAWLTPGRVDKAKLTLKLLQDPSIRSLYGPQKLTGWLWDRAVGGVMRRSPLDELGRLPSSIPKDTFARALIDTLHREAKAAYGPLELSDGIQSAELPVAVEATKELLKAWAGRIDAGVTEAAATIDALPMDREMKDWLIHTLREVSLSRELQARQGRMEGVAAEVRSEIDARLVRAQVAVDEAVPALGAWFDQTMDRVTGWYVRRAKWVLFLLGFVMAAVVNFDVIGYGDQLLNDEGLRRRIAAQAEAAVAAEAVGELTVERSGPRQLAALIVNTDRDGTVSPEELDASLSPPADGTGRELGPSLRTALGLPADPAAPVSEAQRDNALAVLNRALTDMRGAAPIDLDEDSRVSPEEEDAAIEAFVENLRDEIGTSLGLLESQFADQGVEMGWKCPGGAFSAGCVRDQINLQSVVSWLVMGIGCTLGGQFWFDLLRQVVKVKTAASGLNSDIKRVTGATGATGATGGRAQGGGARQGA